METTKTVTVVEYSRDPLPHTSLEVETLQPTLTSDEKKSAVGVLAAAGGIIGCCTIILLWIALGVPILSIIIGLHYKDQCPIQPKIPLFLYVSGIIGVIVAIFPLLIFVLGFIQAKKSQGRGEADAERAATASVKLITIIGIVTVLLSVALVIWFICGMFWTFGVFNRVSYNINDHGRYCNRVLYAFTFVLLVLGLIQTVAHCLCGGLKSKKGR